MPLRSLDLSPSDAPIPVDVARFLREADRRIDLFQDACRVPGFVPSDYCIAYRVLRAVAESGLARGRQFCEWGSGFGVVACLAAMLDFDSCGVEVENILVQEARKLAEDFELPVEFAAGSYVPRGAEDRIHRGGSYSWFSTEGDYAYEDLGLDPVDMDVVFAYPWPDEEPVTLDLFQRYCGPGALLITFHGGEDIRVRRNRKASRRGRH
jgi:hypothetical protein